MPSRLGFLVEGPDDRDVITQILEKLRVTFRVRVARGSGNLKRKLPSIRSLMLSSGCTKIIVLKDLNCMDYNEVRSEFEEFTSNNTKICIIIHELESWLLADPIALSNVLHKQIGEISDPENIHDPKSRMRTIFEKSGKRYVPSRDLPEIAGYLNLDAVRRKCKSYLTFETLVRDC